MPPIVGCSDEPWEWTSDVVPSLGLPSRTPSASPSPRRAALQDYNEQVQDNLYLQEAQILAEERFQDYIYLRFAQPQLKAAASAPNCKSTLSTTTGGALRSEGQLPVKHTFIHYDDHGAPEEEEGPHARSSSAPHVLMHHEFRLKHQAVEQAHARGECRPCAYYLYKQDGCRRGFACDFCHFCEEGERKKRKKEKARQWGIMKMQARQMAA